MAFDAVADAVALQSDGKIVVAGEISSLAGVLRLNTNGTLDSGFGAGGMVTINVPSGLGGGVQVIGVAVQIDGKIIAGILIPPLQKTRKGGPSVDCSWAGCKAERVPVCGYLFTIQPLTPA